MEKKGNKFWHVEETNEIEDCVNYDAFAITILVATWFFPPFWLDEVD